MLTDRYHTEDAALERAQSLANLNDAPVLVLSRVYPEGFHAYAVAVTPPESALYAEGWHDVAVVDPEEVA